MLDYSGLSPPSTLACRVPSNGSLAFSIDVSSSMIPASSGYIMSQKLPPQRTSNRGKTQAGAHGGETGDVQFGALLMTEGATQRSGPPPLFRGLTESEKARVLESGKRKVLYHGAQLFRQGSPQDGIYL